MQKELKYLILPCFLILQMALQSGCRQNGRKIQEVSPLPVNIRVVQPTAHPSSTRYMGVIEAATEIPLSLQSGGRVVSVHVKSGDAVRPGTVLVRTDSTQAVHALHAAQAAYRQAKDGYERVQKVHAKGGVTDQKMVEVEMQMQQARSVYQAALRRVHECTLSAPCEGVVSGLELKPGQMTAPGVPVCTIIDMSAYSVRFTVPENEVGTISVGQGGEMECSATGRVYPITVTEKGVQSNAVAHTYSITARVAAHDAELMPGMIAKCRLVRPAQDAQVIVPARCIIMMPDSATVWVKEKGTAQRRAIVTGGYQADGVVVKSGLEAGDSLITDGYQKLFKGALVVENK